MNQKTKQIFDITVTDTFGGEPNFGWVRRYKMSLSEDASNLSLVRAAKQAAGLSGIRGDVEHEWDGFTFRPRGLCQVMFVNLNER